MDQEACFSSWSFLEHEADLNMTDKCQTNVESGVNNGIYSQEGNYGGEREERWGGGGSRLEEKKITNLTTLKRKNNEHFASTWRQ